ncbi:MAG: hypothetical protein Q8O52_13850 [Sulfuritalea sp.]|nr:hypothetical protein [Sulfuritalea sp.]
MKPFRGNDFVIPAKAGIQAFWAPAFAGATESLIAAGAATWTG